MRPSGDGERDIGRQAEREALGERWPLEVAEAGGDLELAFEEALEEVRGLVGLGLRLRARELRESVDALVGTDSSASWIALAEGEAVCLLAAERVVGGK